MTKKRQPVRFWGVERKRKLLAARRRAKEPVQPHVESEQPVGPTPKFVTVPESEQLSTTYSMMGKTRCEEHTYQEENGRKRKILIVPLGISDDGAG